MFTKFLLLLILKYGEWKHHKSNTEQSGSLLKYFIFISPNNLKVINQEMSKKHIILIQCMIDCWHFYDTASSSPLLAVRFTHFYLNFNYHGISRLCTSVLSVGNTIEVFFYRNTIYSQAFRSKWRFSWAIFFPGHLLIL